MSTILILCNVVGSITSCCFFAKSADFITDIFLQLKYVKSDCNEMLKKYQKF